MNDLVESGQPEQPRRGLAIGYATPGDLLRIAIEQNADLDRLEKLMDLQDRWQAGQARMAFIEAMAEFKKDAPTIIKNKLVEYSGTSYMHAELSEVTDAIVPGLAKVGISHAWKPEQLEHGIIRVTCTLTHKLGHSESVSLESLKDDSGKKNNIQAIASALTYMERYTLLMVTGLSTKSQTDDDGRGAEPEPLPPEPTPEEIAARNAADAARRKAVHDAALGRHSESVDHIKLNLGEGRGAEAYAEYMLIPEEDRIALGLAHSKGGCFTTAEGKAMNALVSAAMKEAREKAAAADAAALDKATAASAPK